MKELQSPGSPLIGRRGYITFKTAPLLQVEVELVDVKNAYGTTRYRVRPIAGLGEATVENIKLIKK